jgi:hypothetical protein
MPVIIVVVIATIISIFVFAADCFVTAVVAGARIAWLRGRGPDPVS